MDRRRLKELHERESCDHIAQTDQSEEYRFYEDAGSVSLANQQFKDQKNSAVNSQQPVVTSCFFTGS